MGLQFDDLNRSSVLERHRDAGTSDFLTGLVERHEKTAWMFRACLAGGVRTPGIYFGGATLTGRHM